MYEEIAHSAFNSNNFWVTDWAFGEAAGYYRQAQPYLNACNTREP